MDNWFYPNHRNNWDDYIFRERILKHINQDTELLDLGAGAGILPQMNFKGMVKRVVGIDLDPRVVYNPYLDEGKITNGEDIPYPENSFDVVCCDNVFEHLAKPKTVFDEVARVLRPGGVFIFKTPNKFHYMPVISMVTPHKFHEWIGKVLARESIDTFPTHYKANSVKDVSRLASMSNFSVDKIELIEGRPEYLRFTALTYIFGIIYERVTNSTNLFSMFRILFVGQLRRNP